MEPGECPVAHAKASTTSALAPPNETRLDDRNRERIEGGLSPPEKMPNEQIGRLSWGVGSWEGRKTLPR